MADRDSADVDNALMAYLGADTQLLSLMPNGVYWGIAPPGSTQYVIVSLVESLDLPVFGGGRAFEQILYAVKAVELTTVPVKNSKKAAARIDALLHPQPPAPPLALTIPGYVLKYAAREGNRIRLPEQDDLNPAISYNHRGAHYRLWVAPIET